MADFNLSAARKAGYTDAEIADFLGEKRGIDTGAARSAGYTDGQMLAQLMRPAPSPGIQPATASDSVGMGLMDPVHGGAQLLAHALPSGVVGAVNDATAWVNRQPVIGPVTRALGMTPATPEQIDQRIAQREVDHQAGRQMALPPTMAGLVTGERPPTPGTDWWRVAGQAASTIPVAAAFPAGATLPGTVAAGAASGGAGSALSPVTDNAQPYWAAKGDQVLSGSGVGAVLGPVAHVVGGAIAPRVSPDVRALRDAGVEMTPGQVAGGWVRGLEDKATSIPILGDHIANAQRRSVESFNRSVANDVLRPLGQQVPASVPAGRDLMNEVADRVSGAYQAAISRAKPFGPDQQFAQDLQTAALRFLTPDTGQAFVQRLRNDIVSRMQNGTLDGATYQIVRSELGLNARQNMGSSTAAERELGKAYSAVQRAFDDLMARANPTIAPELVRANAAYARLVRMEGAAGMQGATNGIFTPQQFSAAVRSSDKSQRHGAYARGDALMQDMSDAARNVLPRTVPDSGSVGRLGVPAMVAAAATGVPWPYMAGAGAMYGAYTRPVSNALVGAMTRQATPMQQMIRNALAEASKVPATPLAAGMSAP